ncbi:MAG: DUF3054 family protein [Candidatus Dormibacteraeota bacterium]|uniref:DUF3054 family protein n=1 Tax=Candidatus Aeolococcus gillhamiae TaxID=3127015 RepID=A0A934JTM9_9BACT|nr:DUF3054 family protein [Candidatus Dormibacteraeota bacterium]
MLAGRQSHGLDTGAAWFFVVLWPVAAAWFAVAVIDGLYTRASRPWLRLAGTVVLGVGAGLIARIVVTHRDTPVAFVLVALGFMAVTTAGWRLVSAAVPHVLARRRG